MQCWPAYRVEDVLRMPYYQFRLFHRIGLGQSPQYEPPEDPVSEAQGVVLKMAEWRRRSEERKRRAQSGVNV